MATYKDVRAKCNYQNLNVIDQENDPIREELLQNEAEMMSYLFICKES